MTSVPQCLCKGLLSFGEARPLGVSIFVAHAPHAPWRKFHPDLGAHCLSLDSVLFCCLPDLVQTSTLIGQPSGAFVPSDVKPRDVHEGPHKPGAEPRDFGGKERSPATTFVPIRKSSTDKRHPRPFEHETLSRSIEPVTKPSLIFGSDCTVSNKPLASLWWILNVVLCPKTR